MSWLTSPVLFYGSLPLTLAAPFVLLWFTARYPKTEQTFNEHFRDILRSPLSDIADKLGRLLRSGHDRAHLVVIFTKSGYFLQYRKYIHAKGDYGIELGFPVAEWSRPFVPGLRAYCDANGIAYAEGSEVPGDSMAFIHVDFGRDAGAAFDMAKAIVTEVFEIPTDSTYNWEFDGLSYHDELIDNPRSRPPSGSEVWRRMRNDIHDRSGLYVGDIVLFMIGGLSRYTGAIGLLHGLAWKSAWAVMAIAPNWGAVTATLPGATFEARNFDIVCIGLIAIAMVIRRSPSGRRLRAREQDKGESGLQAPAWLRGIGRIIPRGLRLPAILGATIAFWIV